MLRKVLGVTMSVCVCLLPIATRVGAQAPGGDGNGPPPFLTLSQSLFCRAALRSVFWTTVSFRLYALWPRGVHTFLPRLTSRHMCESDSYENSILQH